MAGQPRRRALIGEIEKRTRATFEDDADKGHLDYLLDWLESGKTFLALTHSVNKSLKYTGENQISHGTVSRYFNTLAPDAGDRIKTARAGGAFAMADSTADIADEDVSSTEQAARARNRIGSRQWLAEKFNREALGQPKQGAVNVSVSVGGLHLDALRVRVTASSPARDSDEVAIDSSAIAGAIGAGEEIVSDAVIEALL